ncbi:hypothetical protein OEZ85_012217 [Tetradesmus obliquus]|uniref:Uncharacterized protein n=1 Tax=Tetradesmus obliquus TaxID=3088 RepID=A0ABY8TSP1_TETOB|nr:hypothetical protein OEZ85_012217 [Tetradesmus obliquus]
MPAAGAGWRLKACHSEHFLRLHHPQLQLQLDLQVAKYHGDTKEQQRQHLLQPLLEAAETAGAEAAARSAAAKAEEARRRTQLAAGASAGSTGVNLQLEPDVYPGDQHPEEWEHVELGNYTAFAARVPEDPERITVSRRRVTDLSESQTAVIKGVNELYKQRGRHGYGQLVTDVIRAVKAWSKFGLPVALKAAGAAADDAKPPPGYLWELFVLYVLEQQTQHGCVYDPGQPLELFMDVMHAASQRLRCSDPPEQQQQQQQQQQQGEPIILDLYYTKQQALLPAITQCWGTGPLYRPAIINPVDPTYNCTAWQPFRQWDELAAAAGELHKQLQQALEGRGRAGAAGSSGGGSTAWEALCRGSSCTLGAAVEAFEH